MIGSRERVLTINAKTWLKRLGPVLLITCVVTFQYSGTFQKSRDYFNHRSFENSTNVSLAWSGPSSLKAELIHEEVTSKVDYLPSSDVTYSPPVCDNFLANFTSGKWVRKFDKEKPGYWIQKEKRIDKSLRQYWIDRGIGSSFVGIYGQCGYNIYQTKVPGSQWPDVGAWCDKNSDRPCCSNMYTGTCEPKSEESCKCTRCVDMTELLHAETSKWIVDDNRCQWRNYSAEESCHVLANSPYEKILFAGDSMLRNFYQALMMIITGDPISGHRIIKDEKCKGPDLFHWPECRLRQQPPREFVCKDGRSFKLERIQALGFQQAKNFNDTIHSIARKSKTLIIIAVGIHLSYEFNKAYRLYLKPVMDLREQFFMKSKAESPSQTVTRWPKLMVFSAQKVGLLKPTKFLKHQGHSRNALYHKKMKSFCDEHGIPFFHFVPLTKQILSFDGTHQGFHVNLLKAQMFLNYIAGQN